MSTTTAVPAIGTELPDIPLTAADGTASTLHRQTVGRTVIFFMRASNCPICRAHVRALERMRDAGTLGDATVVIVVPGGRSQAPTVARLTTLKVWASGDHHADLGLGRFLMLQHSGTFVVDADGSILSAVTSALPTASFSKSAVIEALGR
ncbi:MAG: redoxin domain-containing protein [Pseudolysinimonas sp.]|uniref:redoxin domain-containing protein n=1 Tax=Pseudolysinimonas sp. TaxID=2680009 RepID=UPI003266C23B